MAFDWEQYLLLAEELIARQDESCKRSAISRAYYAIYGRARENVPTGIFAKSNKSPHKAYWEETFAGLDRKPDKTDKTLKERGEISALAGRLLKSRHDADYVSNLPNIGDTALGSVELARRIMTMIERVLGPNASS